MFTESSRFRAQAPPEPAAFKNIYYGKHIFTDLFAVCICCTWKEEFDCKKNKEELHKYITGLVQKRKSKMLAINCMPDHTHFFVGFKPTIFIPDFVKEIKVESNEFISSKKWTRGKFNWQHGYGVFSYSHSHIDKVVKYVLNQEAPTEL